MQSLLENLKKRGIKLAVLSNKPDRQAVHVVSAIFGEGLFDQVHGQREGVPRKPDPAAVLQIASELGAAPEETVYIGDSEGGSRDRNRGRDEDCAGVVGISRQGSPDQGRCEVHCRFGRRDPEYSRRRVCMSSYSEECLNVFLKEQSRLFDEPVAETPEEAEAFLEDCMAVVVDSLSEVRENTSRRAEADVDHMTEEELEEASEVFSLPDGKYLIVEG